jgi:hypothetical protein
VYARLCSARLFSGSDNIFSTENIVFTTENLLGVSCNLTTVCTSCAVLLSNRDWQESSVLSGAANDFLLGSARASIIITLK